jgi:hypothetical protein
MTVLDALLLAMVVIWGANYRHRQIGRSATFRRSRSMLPD